MSSWVSCKKKMKTTDSKYQNYIMKERSDTVYYILTAMKSGSTSNTIAQWSDYKTFGGFFNTILHSQRITWYSILKLCCIIADLEGRIEIGHDSCDTPSIYTVPALYAHQCTNTNKDLPSVATSRKSLLPPVKLHTPWIWMKSYAMCLLMNVIRIL